MVADSSQKRYAAEFLGTFLLVLTVGCIKLTSQATIAANWGPTSIAAILAVCIFALGNVSGAHLNPAVSLAIGLAGKAPWLEVGIYAAVQTLAGILAGYLCRLAFAKQGQSSVVIAPNEEFGWFEALIVEMLYTCMLCFVVLNVAATQKESCREFAGLAIGFVIIAGGHAGGGISGGAFNPAVVLGVDVSAGKSLSWCAVYPMYHAAGAFLAAGLFRIVRPDEYYDEEPARQRSTPRSTPRGTRRTTPRSPPPEYSLRVMLVSEFVGTFYLCLTVGLNVLGKSAVTAWSAAASLTCMIYALGSVSGAHFNPAVSVALSLRAEDPVPPTKAAAFVIAQLSAGIVASFLCTFVEHGKTYGFEPVKPYGWGAVAASEVTFTFLLCLVVLRVCSGEKPLQEFHGFAIGSCVTAGGFAVGAVSGGALNPAVAVGASVVDLMHKGSSSAVNALAFAALELLGGVLATAVCRIVSPAPHKGLY